MRWAAWILLTLTTAFWLWFGMGSAWVEKLGLVNWVMHLILPGGLLLSTLLAAWRWSAVGGALSALEGFLAMAAILWAAAGRYSRELALTMTLTLPLPLLVAGALLLLSRGVMTKAKSLGG